jgi:hypothetical protein
MSDTLFAVVRTRNECDNEGDNDTYTYTLTSFHTTEADAIAAMEQGDAAVDPMLAYTGISYWHIVYRVVQKPCTKVRCIYAVTDDRNDTLTFYTSEEAMQAVINTCPGDVNQVLTECGGKNVRCILQENGLC